MFWYLLVTYAVVLEIVGLFVYTILIAKAVPKWQARMTREMLENLEDLDEDTNTEVPNN